MAKNTTETYTLKEPVTLGKISIESLMIDHHPKGKYWRVAQRPMAVAPEMDGSDGVTVMVTAGEAEIELMQQMTGQPLEVIDELGVVDFDKLFGDATVMLGNFKDAKHLPQSAA